MNFPHARRRSWLRFALHYAEMVIAMIAGMMIFGALEAAVLKLAGLSYSADTQPILAATMMTVYMALGMALWMRVRGHDGRAVLEMSGVMFVPAAVLGPLQWAGLLSGDALLAIMHAAMFPLMLAVMFRRRAEYAGSRA
ncbi:MAG TPA: hypothetical protein VFU43_04395 [Streptosporangiaceae bacterium]|nr:hypothetical protein [Streptosporangiaceae bacterium]